MNRFIQWYWIFGRWNLQVCWDVTSLSVGAHISISRKQVWLEIDVTPINVILQRLDHSPQGEASD